MTRQTNVHTFPTRMHLCHRNDNKSTCPALQPHVAATISHGSKANVVERLAFHSFHLSGSPQITHAYGLSPATLSSAKTFFTPTLHAAPTQPRPPPPAQPSSYGAKRTRPLRQRASAYFHDPVDDAPPVPLKDSSTSSVLYLVQYRHRPPADCPFNLHYVA